MKELGGKMEYKKESEGSIDFESFETDTTMILDGGNEIFTWVGKKTKEREKKNVFINTVEYLFASKTRPFWIPISIVEEGQETKEFKKYLEVQKTII